MDWPDSCLAGDGADKATGPAARPAVVAVAASAGGMEAMFALLSALPAPYAIHILLVQHLSRTASSSLPALITARTRHLARWARHGEPVQPEAVHIAPPDRHLLVDASGRLALSSSGRVNFCRPSADVLFESVARVFGKQSVGIVLSGMLWDGAWGMASITKAGGTTIAQDEASAREFAMPSAAIDLGRADLVLSPARIAAVLEVLADSRGVTSTASARQVGMDSRSASAAGRCPSLLNREMLAH